MRLTIAIAIVIAILITSPVLSLSYSLNQTNDNLTLTDPINEIMVFRYGVLMPPKSIDISMASYNNYVTKVSVADLNRVGPEDVLFSQKNYTIRTWIVIGIIELTLNITDVIISLAYQINNVTTQVREGAAIRLIYDGNFNASIIKTDIVFDDENNTIVWYHEQFNASIKDIYVTTIIYGCEEVNVDKLESSGCDNPSLVQSVADPLMNTTGISTVLIGIWGIDVAPNYFPSIGLPISAFDYVPNEIVVVKDAFNIYNGIF